MSVSHAQLVSAAERQLELAEAGRWDELVVAMEEFQRRSAALPAIAPASAAAALSRCAELAGRVEATLRAGRIETARELSRLQRGRGAVRSYVGAAATAGGRLDDSA